MSSRYRPSIALVTNDATNCNCRALYKEIPEFIQQKYNVQLLESTSSIHQEIMINSEIVVTTHRNYASSNHQVNVELWHGFPFEKVARMDPTDHSHASSQETLFRHWSRVNAIASYSPLYSTLFNACMGATGLQYEVTGMPRNDQLFTSSGRENIEALIGTPISRQKVLIYVPHWRGRLNQKRGGESRQWTDLFSFDSLGLDRFGRFLTEQDAACLIKIHPEEESYFAGRTEELKSQGIYLLTDAMFLNADLQLYALLNGCDMLITDYSSVAFDYLLLDRPIVYTPTDLEEQSAESGFLLYPFEFWTPGPKATNQEQLESVIHSHLTQDNYRAQRAKIRHLVHQFQDDHAIDRVWQMIDNAWEGQIPRYNVENDNNSDQTIKEQVKQKISSFIEQGKLAYATQAISDYEQKIGRDADLLTMSAILHFMQGHSDKAVKLLLEGRLVYPGHFDIHYNLGYIHMENSDFPRAAFYFHTAKQLAADESSRAEIDVLLNQFNLGSD